MASAGSIALIAFGADGASGSADPFSFVLLDESLRGQTIYISDNGVNANGTFRTGEGVLSFTIPNDAAIGAVFSRTNFSNVTGSYDGSGSGDSVTAWIGTATSATQFLFQIDYGDGNTGYAGSATNTNTTAVAPGLVLGETALAFAEDNGVYTGPTTGTADEIRAAIADPANWTRSETVAASYTGGDFTIGDASGPARVTVSDVAVFEGDDGTSAMTFTVTRSNADSAFTVDYSTADGSATAGSDYTGTTGTLTFEAGGATSQTITVLINGDTEMEPSESFTLLLDNLVQTSGETTITDGTATGTIRNDDVGITYIHDIQGAAFFSPILAGDGISSFNQASTTQVTVRAIVTAIDSFAGSGQTGFYITEETTDWDGSALTSEGIFVQTNGVPSGLTVGETVTVTANVMERQDFTNLPRTILVNATSIIQGNDTNSLPTFVINGTPGHSIPTAAISNDNPDFRDSTGASGTFDPQNDALDFYETIEGMRITMTNMVVGDGFVSGSDNAVYFNAYSYDNADKNFVNSRGGYTAYGDAQFYPDENTADPNDDVKFGGATSTDGAPHGDMIELDFSNVGRGGTSGFDQDLTMGDRLGDVSGIVDFDFNAVKLYVTDALDPDRIAALDETTPIQEVTELDGGARSLRVATFNVENLSPVGTTFSTNNGVEVSTQAKFNALAQNIAQNLKSPDIIIVEEVQDNNGVTSTGGADASTTWQQLVSAVNAATGRTYQWVDETPSTPNDVGGAPGGNIRTGFLYDTARVQLGDLAADASVAERREFTDRIGDGIRDAGDRIAIDDSQVGGINTADWSGTRRSIVGEFTFAGQTVYVFGSHLPSKGGSDDAYTLNQNGSSGNPTNGDWDRRNDLAEDLHAMQSLATASGGYVVSGGDFNEFWYNRPLEVLTGYATPQGTAGNGTKYVNLMVQELAPGERFSYDFDGRSQALDSLLSDQVLAGVASYDVVHINTGYNERDGAFNPASSDHDPSLASFNFRELAERLTGTDAAETLNGYGGDDTLLAGAGDDKLAGGDGDDVLNGGNGNDTAVFRSATGVTVSLMVTGEQNTGEGLDRLENIENLAGTAAADFLTGNDDANRLTSNGGADSLLGLGGNDTITIEGNVALVDGGSGDDRLVVSGRYTTATDDTFTSIERIIVRDGAEVDLSGVSSPVASVKIESGVGGGVSFVGTAGRDTISGGAGADVIGGGLGADDVRGGSGADRFVFRTLADIADGQRDRILDFSVADGDVIDLSRIDADADLEGVQHLTFIGSQAFSGAAGDDYELRLQGPLGNGDYRAAIDLDHDKVADKTFIIRADGALTEDSFLLEPAVVAEQQAAVFLSGFAPVENAYLDRIGHFDTVLA